MIAFVRIFALGVICAALTACGGGGSASIVPPAAATSAPGTTSVAIAITIPAAAKKAASTGRRPRYISSGTQSASITINGGAATVVNLTPSSPGCKANGDGSYTCSVAVNAPIGPDSFGETLYSLINAGGSRLSVGTTSATIVAGQANLVSLVLDGVVNSIGLALNPANPSEGAPTKVGFTVNLLDGSGATIIGSDPLQTPVTLTNSDHSGATALSKTVLNTPADATALSIAYSGVKIPPAVFGASAGASVTASVTLTPSVFNDYVTFGYDNGRDVFNPNSTGITPAQIANFRIAWQKPLGTSGDYNTQTQPILATEIPGHAGVLFVGGGSGNLYGYDALSGALLWTTPTGQETYTCENSNTIYFGIGGTVAYDPASKSLYAVGNANPSPNAIATNSLFHLDAASGSILGQVNFAPPVKNWPSLDFSHTSVLLNNGVAYVGTGATCDISSWRGRVAAVSVPAMTLAHTFYPVWNGTTQPWGGGGVWGWGGVSADFNGNVLTGIGNTDNGQTSHGQINPPYVKSPAEYSGLGESFVSLTADLSTVNANQHPIPDSAYQGSSVDLDLNGTPTIFKPNGAGCDPIAALQAKSGALYLYDTNRIATGPLAQFQLSPSAYTDEFLGGPAYSPATGLLYAAVPTKTPNTLYPPGLVAINPGCGAPYYLWNTAFGPDSASSDGVSRSVPAVSAGGVVFVGTPCASDGKGGCSGSAPNAVSRATESVRRKPQICCAPPGQSNGALWALDASTGALLNGGLPLLVTSAPIRVPPTIDGNWVFVLDNNGDFYALTIDTSYPAAALKARALDSRMLRRWEAQPPG